METASVSTNAQGIFDNVLPVDKIFASKKNNNNKIQSLNKTKIKTKKKW